MAYILLVDDDRDFAETTAVVLRQAGHEVSVEVDVDSALESIDRRPPDLLILDVMFSEDISAGFTLARTIRRHHESRRAAVPILMLTAVNMQFPLGFGRKDIDDEWLPVSDFLEKPVDLEHLVRRVDELLGKPARQ